MTSEHPVHAAADVPRARLRQQLGRAETLRRVAQRSSHELAQAQESLAERLPADPLHSVAMRAVRLPAAAFAVEGLWFCLDECQRGEGRTTIRGWAFCPTLDRGHTATTLILQGERGTYFIAAEGQRRVDVAQALAGQEFGLVPDAGEADPVPVNLARVGFHCEVHNDSVAPGAYELLLHLETVDGAAVRQPAGVRLEF